MVEKSEESKLLLCCFKSELGEQVGDVMALPEDCIIQQLNMSCNVILNPEEFVHFLFYVNDIKIKHTLQKTLTLSNVNTEGVIDVIYQQQAVLKVRSPTKCTSSMPDHVEAVISVS